MHFAYLGVPAQDCACHRMAFINFAESMVVKINEEEVNGCESSSGSLQSIGIGCESSNF